MYACSIVATVAFKKKAYTYCDIRNNKTARPTLILSIPSTLNITLQVYRTTLGKKFAYICT